jgi:hypothetical protein
MRNTELIEEFLTEPGLDFDSASLVYEYLTLDERTRILQSLTDVEREAPFWRRLLATPAIEGRANVAQLRQNLRDFKQQHGITSEDDAKEAVDVSNIPLRELPAEIRNEMNRVFNAGSNNNASNAGDTNNNTGNHDAGLDGVTGLDDDGHADGNINDPSNLADTNNNTGNNDAGPGPDEIKEMEPGPEHGK